MSGDANYPINLLTRILECILCWARELPTRDLLKGCIFARGAVSRAPLGWIYYYHRRYRSAATTPLPPLALPTMTSPFPRV